MDIWSIGGREDVPALLDGRQHEIKLNLGHREIQDVSSEITSGANK